MSAPVIELVGIPVRAPVTVLTSLFLALQCAVFAMLLFRPDGGRSGRWPLVFGTLGVAALAGVFKHGVPDGSVEALRSGGHLVASLGTAVAATVLGVSRWARRQGWGSVPRWVSGIATAQLVLVCGAAVAFGSFGLVALHCAAMLLPAMALELRAIRSNENPEGRAEPDLLVGLVLLSLTGLVYAWAPRLNAWVDHIDISHVLLSLSFVLLFRAAEVEEGPWTA